MNAPVRWFLRSAVLWLAAGMAMGIWMGADPSKTLLLHTAHLHALLPGFVLFMIFGVGYHVLPRFAGRGVPWAAGPAVHVVLANVGVLILVGGFMARASRPALGQILIPAGGAATLAGAAIFIHAVWRLTERPTWNR